MGKLSYSESILVDAPPESVYGMVADVTRMGEWSPIVTRCWWDDDGAQGIGAWFSGRNELPERTWDTRCRVLAAEPGREFAFAVCGPDGTEFVRWGYTLAAVDGGTELTESWEFLPAGFVRFEERFGEDAPARIADRTKDAHEGIPITLAAIKKAAESE